MLNDLLYMETQMHPIAVVVLVLIVVMVVAIGWLIWTNLNDIDERRYCGRGDV